MKKRCPSCNAEVKGRSDKIFCSAQCKSIHQYERRAVKENFFLQVDKQLKINRKLLKKYNQSGYTTLRKEPEKVLHLDLSSQKLSKEPCKK